MNKGTNLAIEVKEQSVLILFQMEDGDEVAVDVGDIALLSSATGRRLLLEWCDAHKRRGKLEAQKRSGRAG